jgi:hypothetical protein
MILLTPAGSIAGADPQPIFDVMKRGIKNLQATHESKAS